jgi:hypothetical protein
LVWTAKGVNFPRQGALFTITHPTTGKVVTIQAGSKAWKGNLESDPPPGAIKIKKRSEIK